MNFLLRATPSSAFVLACALVAGCGTATTADTDTGSSGNDAAATDAASTTDTGVDSGAPDAAVRVPMHHRVDDSACSGAAPAGNCSFGGGGAMCTMDSDCTTGVNGRCNANNGGALFCRCTYDTCMHDSDCPTDQACACHGADFHPDSNECIAGNCRVDSDCGVNGFCSPTIGGCGGLAGYYCRTAADTCVDDVDCTGSLQACQYSSGNARWECMDLLLCG